MPLQSPLSVGPYFRIPISRCLLVLAVLVPLCHPLLGETISPRKQTLLKRKAELLKSIKLCEQQETQSQSNLDQAAAMRKQYEDAADSKNAAVASEATDVAKRTLADARKLAAEEHERLDAINRALNRPETDKPQAFATLVRGQVFRLSAKGWVPFDPNVPVGIGDRVQTGAGSFLELQLEDGTVMHIGSNSELTYEQDVQGIFYQLFKGEIHEIKRPLGGVRGANDQPRYRGAIVVVAVRGTEFTLEVKDTQDVLTVFEGEIEVDPGAGRAKVVLRAGQSLPVSTSGSVAPPAAFERNTAPHWWEQ
jgi:ferric-dicitrate binding protein FerR (iron transport regulator)